MSGQLHFGPFRIELGTRRLYRGTEVINLTPKALELLLFFVTHPGEVLSRDQILEAVWPGVYVDDHALSVQIRDIRKALGDDPKAPTYIETRHRMGYCFKMPVSRPASAVPDAGEAATIGADAARAAPPVYSGETVPETRYARSGDVDIAYQVLGDGPVDMIFVMGWVSHLEYFWAEPSFARFLRRLASFSRLILFDKRGTGLSDRVPVTQLPTIEQRMYDLRTVMDAVGSKRAVICGVSEGGPLSLVFSATYPDRTSALVMIGTYARRLWAADYPWGPTAEQREQYLNEIRDHWGGPIGLEERAPSRASDASFRRWWATYLRMGASPSAAVALTRMNAEIDVRAILPAVRVPTLVLHRTGDACLKVDEGRYVASQIPNSRFVELPGDDHLPFVGDQDAILAEIEGFVASVRAVEQHEWVLAAVLAMEIMGAARASNSGELTSEIQDELRWFRGNLLAQHNGLLATFDGPERAVRCAASLVNRIQKRGLTARAGIHLGECEHPRTGRSGGPAVDIAGHIRNAGSPGEVVVSSTVRDLVAGSGLRFHARGELHVPNAEYELRLWRLEL